jgi:hypothetical protein
MEKVSLSQIREGQTITWGKMPTRIVASIERTGNGRIVYFTDGTHDFLGNAAKVTRA